MKILFALALSGVSLIAAVRNLRAQTEKGNWLLGGNGSFKHYSYPPNHLTNNTIMISPSGGLFIINNLAIGVSPVVQWETDHIITSNTSSYRLSSGALSIGPFARYYLGISDNIDIFGRTNFNLGHHFTNQKSDPSEKYNFYQYGIGLGVTFFLGNNSAIELSFGRSHYHSFYKSEVVTSPANNDERNYNLLDIEAGFNIYLPPKH